MPSIFYLILRSARRARLEGRIESMQRLNRESPGGSACYAAAPQVGNSGRSVW